MRTTFHLLMDFSLSTLPVYKKTSHHQIATASPSISSTFNSMFSASQPAHIQACILKLLSRLFGPSRSHCCDLQLTLWAAAKAANRCVHGPVCWCCNRDANPNGSLPFGWAQGYYRGGQKKRAVFRRSVKFLNLQAQAVIKTAGRLVFERTQALASDTKTGDEKVATSSAC